MTNEQIAKVMGWECENDLLLDGSTVRYPTMDIADAKLLQAKMVADGWDILILNHHSGIFIASAYSVSTDNGAKTILVENFATEPLAIAELFCKVYSIEAK